jgi:hypothetical protein
MSIIALVPMTTNRVCIKEFLFEKLKEAYEKEDRRKRKTIAESYGTADEVLRGWDLLIGESIPVDIYLETFYISTLDTNLKFGNLWPLNFSNRT